MDDYLYSAHTRTKNGLTLAITGNSHEDLNNIIQEKGDLYQTDIDGEPLVWVVELNMDFDLNGESFSELDLQLFKLLVHQLSDLPVFEAAMTISEDDKRLLMLAYHCYCPSVKMLQNALLPKHNAEEVERIPEHFVFRKKSIVKAVSEWLAMPEKVFDQEHLTQYFGDEGFARQHAIDGVVYTLFMDIDHPIHPDYDEAKYE